jgi:hypothetical protein
LAAVGLLFSGGGLLFGGNEGHHWRRLAVERKGKEHRWRYARAGGGGPHVEALGTIRLDRTDINQGLVSSNWPPSAF